MGRQEVRENGSSHFEEGVVVVVVAVAVGGGGCGGYRLLCVRDTDDGIVDSVEQRLLLVGVVVKENDVVTVWGWGDEMVSFVALLAGGCDLGCSHSVVEEHRWGWVLVLGCCFDFLEAR